RKARLRPGFFVAVAREAAHTWARWAAAPCVEPAGSTTFPALEQRLQAGERAGPGPGGPVLGLQRADPGVVDLPRVLVVVAVHAQQLPVAAIGRVVVVVVVAVVDRQLVHVGAGELARAAPADPRVHLQRPLAV